MDSNVYVLKAMKIFASILSIVASLYVIAAVIVFFIPGAYRIYAFEIQEMFSFWMPSMLKGSFVYALPFGGGIRGDFLAYALALKLLARVLKKAAK